MERAMRVFSWRERKMEGVEERRYIPAEAVVASMAGRAAEKTKVAELIRWGGWEGREGRK